MGNALRCSAVHPRQPSIQSKYGFVNFSNEYDAQNALQNLNGSEIDGRIIEIKFKERNNNRSRTNYKTLGINTGEKQPQDVEQDDQSSSNSEDDIIIPVQVLQIQPPFVPPPIPKQMIVPPPVPKQMIVPPLIPKQMIIPVPNPKPVIIPVPQPIPDPEPEPEPELDNRFSDSEWLTIQYIKDFTDLDQDAAIQLYVNSGKNAEIAINFHLDHTF
ncbi:MAG: hypothetical protein EZS28_030819 [Streblomastix strix]|uniref:RRM domain-containing protein n=1 Tax=Streblomastix strix TaxID=222440 RepID=A0A5J4UUC5_9EUKA|nr:MAG: hypothetical protein EZS28_030819 [Streblomastix strix]